MVLSLLSINNYLHCYAELVFAFIAAPSDGKKAEYKEDGLSVDVKLPIKHVLSRELQVRWTVLGTFGC